MEKLSFNAAVLSKQNNPLDLINNIQIPELKEGQVLVKLAYSGLCHSQIMEIDGKRGRDKYIPHLLGHEGSGLVIEVGKGVKKIKPGDKVVLTWIKAKGMESETPSFKLNGQTINAGSVTTFNEYSVVSENRCVRLPRGIPMDIAAYMGCAVLTGSGLIRRELKPKKRSTIAFFGLGGIGINALMEMSLQEPKIIFAIDINTKRLKIAKELGADVLINPNFSNPLEIIRKETEGLGVDYAIESAGLVSTIEDAFDSIKRNGGKLYFASHPEAGKKIKLDPFELISGKKIFGTWGGGAEPDKDIPYIAKAFKENKLKLQKLKSKKYCLEDINKAINDFRKGLILRPLIELDSSIKNK